MSEKITFFDELDSTNAYAKRNYACMDDGTAVAALRQTAGRGRLGRSFSSCDGGLYMTYMIKPGGGETEESILALTGMTAVAVSRAIRAECGIEPDIKWTNDLLIGGKKICGILAEAGYLGDRLGYIIIGIGVNVNTDTASFPGEIAETATSLIAETGRATDIRRLASAVVSELDAMRGSGASIADYAAEYRRKCVTVGRQVTVRYGDSTVIGTAAAIDDRFGLVVDTDSGRITVRSGEATLR